MHWQKMYKYITASFAKSNHDSLAQISWNAKDTRTAARQLIAIRGPGCTKQYQCVHQCDHPHTGHMH